MHTLFPHSQHPSLDCDYAEFKQRTQDLLAGLVDANEAEAAAGMRLFAASYMGLHFDTTRVQRVLAAELVSVVNRAFEARLQQLQLVAA